MSALKAADSVAIRVLVDNLTDNFSSVPSFVESEFAAPGGVGAARGFSVPTTCAARHAGRFTF
ncbi:MAG: hypothetical protein ACM3JC_07675 [Rudaea sp.]